MDGRLPRAPHLQPPGARVLRERSGDFDLVHDNQTLGSPLLGLGGDGLPLVVSVHHPISIDRRIDLASASGLRRRLVRRWYGFVRMQARVAKRMRLVLTPSESSATDVVREFGVDPARVRPVLLGVEDGFVPPTEPRVSGRILAMASADRPLKGIGHLLQAVAKLRAEHELELHWSPSSSRTARPRS